MNKKKSSPNRTFFVSIALLGVLSLVSLLLLALAPQPLAPGAAESLFAVDSPDPWSQIFDTHAAISPGRWKYIFIHQSGNAAANTNVALTDHFVIGNGELAADGELQISQRWDQQLPAASPAPGSVIAPDCISICLAGNFDRSPPTPTQFHRLVELIALLQRHFNIPASDILFVRDSGGAASVGKHFPVADLARQLAVNR